MAGSIILGSMLLCCRVWGYRLPDRTWGVCPLGLVPSVQTMQCKGRVKASDSDSCRCRKFGRPEDITANQNHFRPGRYVAIQVEFNHHCILSVLMASMNPIELLRLLNDRLCKGSIR